MFRRTSSLLILFVVLIVSGQAQAVKFLSLKKTIKMFAPQAAKVFKVNKTLSESAVKLLSRDFGVNPSPGSYTFYIAKDASSKPIAYIILISEQFNTCFHKFAIGLRPSGEVIDLAIVELSCPRAMPINRRSFLSQFRGKKYVDAITLSKDIDGVTGATLSSESAAIATRKAVSLHNLFFGGNRPVTISDEVRQARKKSGDQIQQAIKNKSTAH